MTGNDRDIIDARKRRTVDGGQLTDEIGIDELVDQADTIAEEVDDIAAANEEQTANVRQIQEAVERLNRND